MRFGTMMETKNFDHGGFTCMEPLMVTPAYCYTLHAPPTNARRPSKRCFLLLLTNTSGQAGFVVTLDKKTTALRT